MSVLLQAEGPSCLPTNSVKALKDDSVPHWRQHAAMVSQKHCCGKTRSAVQVITGTPLLCGLVRDHLLRLRATPRDRPDLFRRQLDGVNITANSRIYALRAYVYNYSHLTYQAGQCATHLNSLPDVQQTKPQHLELCSRMSILSLAASSC